MKRSMLRSLSPLALASCALSASALNLVTNGGFETGDFSGWTEGGDTSYGVFVGGPTQSGYGYTPTPHSGSFTAFLGAPYAPVLLSQDLATVAGQSYTLSFYLADDPSGAGSTQTFSVSFGGVTLESFGDLPAVCGLHTYQVAPTGSSSTLLFTSQNFNGAYLLDDVSVTKNVSSVPGPVAALPFALMALRQRRKKAV